MAPPLRLGQRVGSYRLVRLLGEGGMGAVYEGVHEQIERRAALKVLYPELSRHPHFVARFLNEARAVNLVRHPGLVEIFELGHLPDGTTYIVMELLEGELLGARLERGPLPVAETLRLARQIAAALVPAHAKGIIHRDLKPDNLMLVPDVDHPEDLTRTRVKILDFGIAKITGRADPSGQSHTVTGTTIGTPEYMAPEQCRGAADLSGQADVYALGVVLYEMLSGQPPFRAEMTFDVLAMHVRKSPPPLRGRCPGLPMRVAALVHRMLAKDPARRPNLTEVLKALDEALSPPAPPKPEDEDHAADDQRWLEELEGVALPSGPVTQVTAPPTAPMVLVADMAAGGPQGGTAESTVPEVSAHADTVTQGVHGQGETAQHRSPAAVPAEDPTRQTALPDTAPGLAKRSGTVVVLQVPAQRRRPVLVAGIGAGLVVVVLLWLFSFFKTQQALQREPVPTRWAPAEQPAPAPPPLVVTPLPAAAPPQPAGAAPQPAAVPPPVVVPQPAFPAPAAHPSPSPPIRPERRPNQPKARPAQAPERHKDVDLLD